MRRRRGDKSINENTDTKTKQESENKKQQERSLYKHRRIMQIAILICLAIAAIGAIAIGVLLYYHKQTLTVWVTFASVMSIALATCLGWQDNIWKAEAEARTTAEKSKPSTPTEPKLEQPRFREKSGEMTITFGGFTIGTYISEKPYPAAQFGDKAIMMYVEDEILYVDVELFSSIGIPPIEIKHNEFKVNYPGCDQNSNDKAFEVVNEKQEPIFQLIYRSPRHALINGIFPTPGGGFMYATGSRTFQNYIPPDASIKRIFKYPSWQYPGEYEEQIPNSTAQSQPMVDNSAEAPSMPDKKENQTPSISQTMTNSPGGVQAGGNVTINQGKQPRTITTTQRSRCLSMPQGKPKGSLTISCVLGDGESLSFARELEKLLRAAEWKIEDFRQVNFNHTPKGILLQVRNQDDITDYADSLYQALNTLYKTIGDINPKSAKHSLTLIVGQQP